MLRQSYLIHLMCKLIHTTRATKNIINYHLKTNLEPLLHAHGISHQLCSLVSLGVLDVIKYF
jgi:hypothetical protein